MLPAPDLALSWSPVHLGDASGVGHALTHPCGRRAPGALGRRPRARGQEDMLSGQGWHIAQEFEAQNRKSLLSFIFFEFGVIFFLF